jgi:Protein of unknown function (DUF2796)
VLTRGFDVLKIALTLLLTLSLAPVLAHKAHVHGLARMDVALQAGELSVSLEMPLESLLGFERAPRDTAERQQVEAALARLRAPGLLRAQPAAQCTLRSVDLDVPAVLTSAPARSGAAEEHADLQAHWVFDCAQPQALQTLVVDLFEAFARVQRIEVQMVLPAGQRKTVLRPAMRVLRLKS